MTAELAPAIRWHRPLLVLAAAMVPLAAACILGMLVDPRTLLGVSVWEKPLKFALSSVLYAVTWSWLIGQLRRFTRAAWWAGTISTVLLAIELAIITGAAAAGITSHFNVSTSFNTALWSVMAFSITALWIATFVVSVLLFRSPLGEPGRALAIRAGAVLALIGMALAFLMTGPTAEQLNDFQGVAGAHAVGVADGGPGLPLLGWSTVAGDLRIPHFVGMHALQVMPLAAMALEWLARRLPRLRDAHARSGILLTVAVTYAAVLAVLTWQALRGQSIVQPDAATIAVTVAIAIAAAVGLAVVIARAPVPTSAAPSEPVGVR